jgi:hypothetical protein
MKAQFAAEYVCLAIFQEIPWESESKCFNLVQVCESMAVVIELMYKRRTTEATGWPHLLSPFAFDL